MHDPSHFDCRATFEKLEDYLDRELSLEDIRCIEAHLDLSFVRTLVLPAEWAGKRTIRYLEPSDAVDVRQSASVLLEHAIALPR